MRKCSERMASRDDVLGLRFSKSARQDRQWFTRCSQNNDASRSESCKETLGMLMTTSLSRSVLCLHTMMHCNKYSYGTFSNITRHISILVSHTGTNCPNWVVKKHVNTTETCFYSGSRKGLARVSRSQGVSGPKTFRNIVFRRETTSKGPRNRKHARGPPQVASMCERIGVCKVILPQFTV